MPLHGSVQIEAGEDNAVFGVHFHTVFQKACAEASGKIGDIRERPVQDAAVQRGAVAESIRRAVSSEIYACGIDVSRSYGYSQSTYRC